VALLGRVHGLPDAARWAVLVLLAGVLGLGAVRCGRHIVGLLTAVWRDRPMGS